MSKIYFTSDLHFSHKNIAKFCPTFRPDGGDIDKMDESLIKYWNSVVTPDDIVYNLGDVSFSHDLKKIERTLQKLNGQHYLILGNHDGLIASHKKRFLENRKDDGHPMLSSVRDYLKLRLPEVGRTLILSHYPMSEWEGCHKGWYHLHGHLHDRLAKVSGRLLNVGYDLHGRFLTLDNIDEFLKELPLLAHFGSSDVEDGDVCNNGELLKIKLKNLNS